MKEYKCICRYYRNVQSNNYKKLFFCAVNLLILLFIENCSALLVSNDNQIYNMISLVMTMFTAFLLDRSDIFQRSNSPMPSVVPKLIDNKRKHLERRLSASKRDALFLEEAKKETVYRRELIDAIKGSTEAMANALEGISQSMAQVSNVMGKSIEFLVQCNQQSQNWGPMQFGREVFPHARQNQGHVFNPIDIYPQGPSFNNDVN